MRAVATLGNERNVVAIGTYCDNSPLIATNVVVAIDLNPCNLGTMTRLDTQVDALISRMNPAFSSLCNSDAIAFLLGSSNRRSGCLTGFALGSTFSA
jgi:hypothetical protein